MKMTGDELQNIRKGLRLNQDMWAKLACVMRSTVSDWENDKAPIQGLMAKVARFLDKHPELLYEFDPALKDAMKESGKKKAKRPEAKEEKETTK